MKFGSYTEVKNFLQTADLGSNNIQISVTSTTITLEAPACPALSDLDDKDGWMNTVIRSHLKRSFSLTDNKWVPQERTYGSIKESINFRLFQILKFTLKAKAPERTALYKDLKYISQKHINDDGFLDSVVQIMNYYDESRTDSTHILNTLALLELLRKRYNGNKSS